MRIKRRACRVHSAATGLSSGDWQNREMTATRRTSQPRRRGSLQPVELAQASVMAALCAAIAIVAVVVPFAAGISLLGTVPMGLLVYRFRVRVLIAATVAGATIAFLIAGMGGFMTVLNCAYIGLLIGLIMRRGRGTLTVLLVGLVAGAVFGGAVVAALSILVRLRHLIFESMTANVEGIAALLSRIPNWWWLPDMDALAERLKNGFATALHYWPFLLGGWSVIIITVVMLIGWWALSQVVEPARRDTRCAQTRLRTRHGADRARSRAAHRCPLPVSRKRPRRARPGDAERRTRRTRRGDRAERVRQDNADVGARRARSDVGHRRPSRFGWARPARWHRGHPAAPRKSGARHPGRRRRGLGTAARHHHRRASAAHRGRARRPGRTRYRRPVRRRAATPRRRRGARAGAVAADRRRGHQHGRPGGPRRR